MLSISVAKKSDVLKCTLEHRTPLYKTFWGPFFHFRSIMDSTRFRVFFHVPPRSFVPSSLHTSFFTKFSRKYQIFPYFGTLSNALLVSGPALFALLISLRSHIKCHIPPSKLHLVMWPILFINVLFVIHLRICI